MNGQAEPDEFTGLQRILAEWLRKSLEVQDLNLSQTPINIPLNRVKSGTQLKYVSALALKQAPCRDDALSLAQQRVQNLHQAIQSAESQGLSDCICQNLEISISAPGWIYLELSPAALATWLHHGILSVLTPNSTLGLNNTLYNHKFDSHAVEIFMLSYSHARCCSLLRVADAMFSNWQLVLAHPDQALIIWRAVSWEPAEWQLISQIVDVTDRLAWPDAISSDSDQLSKLAYELSRGFQAFYAAYPIGGMTGQDRVLVYRRLGLLLLTQHLLYRLLGMLHLPAPEQL